MFSNKKGTEKPIEIFVALFVILAVALLLLQLFQSQLSDQQTRMDEEARAREQEQIRTSARDYCNSACRDASSRGCTTAAMAAFCLTYGSDAIREPRFLDLNLDGVKGVDDTLMAGIKVCEDAVPCHAMIDNCCGQTINHNSCKRFLENYWNEVGHTPAVQAQLTENLVRTGVVDPICVKGPGMDPLHWFVVGRFNEIGGP